MCMFPFYPFYHFTIHPSFISLQMFLRWIERITFVRLCIPRYESKCPTETKSDNVYKKKVSNVFVFELEHLCICRLSDWVCKRSGSLFKWWRIRYDIALNGFHVMRCQSLRTKSTVENLCKKKNIWRKRATGLIPGDISQSTPNMVYNPTKIGSAQMKNSLNLYAIADCYWLPYWLWWWFILFWLFMYIL